MSAGRFAGARWLLPALALTLSLMGGADAQAREQLYCTKQYAPVCALAPVRCVRAPCPAGVRRTYGNACEARVAGARILHRGPCRKTGKIVPPVIVRPGVRSCRKWVTKTICWRRHPFGRVRCKWRRRCLRWF